MPVSGLVRWLRGAAVAIGGSRRQPSMWLSLARSSDAPVAWVPLIAPPEVLT